MQINNIDSHHIQAWCFNSRASPKLIFGVCTRKAVTWQCTRKKNRAVSCERKKDVAQWRAAPFLEDAPHILPLMDHCHTTVTMIRDISYRKLEYSVFWMILWKLYGEMIKYELIFLYHDTHFLFKCCLLKFSRFAVGDCFLYFICITI